MPLRARKPMQLVIYTPETEFGGGNAFADEFQKHGSAVVTHVGPQTPRATLTAISRRAKKGQLIVLTVVRRVEGRGRVAIAEPFAAWMRQITKRKRPIVVAAGNPYVIGRFSGIGEYMVTFSVGEAPERAAAQALFDGKYPGRSPVSLPGIFSRADGAARSAGH